MTDLLVVVGFESPVQPWSKCRSERRRLRYPGTAAMLIAIPMVTTVAENATSSFCFIADLRS
jgi:hypothetical protein